MEHVHSSGHVSPDVLQRFAGAMNAKMLVPVHGENWNGWEKIFLNIVSLGNVNIISCNM
jgi:ribonuclease J